ncbi:MAG: hypothetical protein PHE44_12770 [Proteiniphilum sp.]|jgi:hypothetical protein|nr:hypothetical protein [Proteiniphilum sp.]MDD3077405.1 hypothetical protein [Proteiniphilum sp.]MDD3957229.1 hypothetical protein [Proteiniphilum sp.]MDD4453661.1 hypothetical protein [Proteiniphilum sp.]
MAKINRELINVKKVIIDTGEEKMIYDQANVAQVFKTSPDKRGRLYLGTKNKVIVIELKDSI